MKGKKHGYKTPRYISILKKICMYIDTSAHIPNYIHLNNIKPPNKHVGTHTQIEKYKNKEKHKHTTTHA